MNIRFASIPIALLLALPAVASPNATTLTKKDKATLSNSILVLNDLASAPDKGIPQDLLAKADCIMIFPSVDKGAFIVGGKSGILTSQRVDAGEPVWGIPARPLRQHLKGLANIGKLSELRNEVRELKKKLEALEKNL